MGYASISACRVHVFIYMRYGYMCFVIQGQRFHCIGYLIELLLMVKGTSSPTHTRGVRNKTKIRTAKRKCTHRWESDSHSCHSNAYNGKYSCMLMGIKFATICSLLGDYSFQWTYFSKGSGFFMEKVSSPLSIFICRLTLNHTTRRIQAHNSHSSSLAMSEISK